MEKLAVGLLFSAYWEPSLYVTTHEPCQARMWCDSKQTGLGNQAAFQSARLSLTGKEDDLGGVSRTNCIDPKAGVLFPKAEKSE